MRRILPLCPLLLALLGAGDAAALGLGQITVNSRLGARFHAEIELLGAPTDGRPITECFRLTQPTDAEPGIPSLLQGRITIERHSGKPRLRVTTEQFINDPIVQISVRAGCGAEVVRDYLLIIDPAEEKAARPAPAVEKTAAAAAIKRPRPAEADYPDHWQADSGESALSIANHLFPRQPSAQRRFLKALQGANPDIDLGERGETPLAAGAKLSIPDTRRQTAVEPTALPTRERHPPASTPPATGRLSDRLSISRGATGDDAKPDDLPLRLATELSLHALSRTSESQRAILRLEYKLLAAIYDQASQQLSVAEQVRQLETSVAELQVATEGSARPAPPVVAEPAPTPVGPTLSSQPSVRSTKSEARESSDVWPWLAALLGSIGALVWFLRRYARKTERPSAVELPPEEPLPWAISEQFPPASPPPDQNPLAPDAENDPFPPGEYTQPPDDGRVLAEGGSNDAMTLTEQNEFSPVIELADIMLSFGRVKGATDALLEYIESNPDEALQPWLKLLEIYRQHGMRQDYENLSKKLKLHFNVDPTHWDMAADIAQPAAALSEEGATSFELLLSRLPNLRQLPHISEKITRLWDSPECLSYLNSLLRNNRKGELLRRGFTLSTVSELLFLLDILEKRRSNPGPASPESAKRMQYPAG